jgi:hypothetical protein
MILDALPRLSYTARDVDDRGIVCTFSLSRSLSGDSLMLLVLVSSRSHSKHSIAVYSGVFSGCLVDD